MTGQDDGGPYIATGGDEVGDKGALGGVEPLLGLIEDEHLTGPKQGERQPEQLGLAGRELVGEAPAELVDLEL